MGPKVLAGVSPTASPARSDWLPESPTLSPLRIFGEISENMETALHFTLLFIETSPLKYRWLSQYIRVA
jgi:hypothetical protein